jgi:hypothetical protein
MAEVEKRTSSPPMSARGTISVLEPLPLLRVQVLSVLPQASSSSS